MKKYLVVLLSLLVVGCGSEEAIVVEDGKLNLPQDPNTSYFGIGETLWSVWLPEGWRKITPPQDSESIFLAYHRSQSFTILQRPFRLGDGSVKDVYQQAKNDFYLFQPLSFSEENAAWSFRGKIDAADPLWEYHQKVFFVPEGDFILIGSCGAQITRVSPQWCQQILQQWQMLKTQTPEEV